MTYYHEAYLLRQIEAKKNGVCPYQDKICSIQTLLLAAKYDANGQFTALYPDTSAWGHWEFCAQMFSQLMWENTELRDGLLYDKNRSETIKEALGLVWKCSLSGEPRQTNGKTLAVPKLPVNFPPLACG